jgi:outer membrane protein
MKYFFIIAFTLQLSIIHCQSTNNKSWSLEQCIDSALVKNNKILKSQLNQEISNIYLKNSKYNYLPSLNGGATHGYNWGQTIDPFTNQFATNRVQYNNFYLNSSVTLFSGFQNYYTQKITTIDYQTQQYNLEIDQRNMKIKVALAYLQVLLNNEMLNVFKEQLLLTQKQKERMQILIDSEKEPEFKIIEIQAQEEMDKYNVLKASNDLNYSLLLLQQIINISYHPNFNIVTFDSISNQITINKTINLNNLPDIKLSELNIQKQEANIKTIKSRMYPTLSLNGSLGSGYSGNNQYLTPNGELQPKPFNTQLSENFYQSASLSLAVPIFNKNVNRRDEQINQIKLEQYQIEKEQLMLELNQKIELLKLEINNLDAQLNSLQFVLESNQKNYSNANLQFENGYTTYTQLLEIKNKLFKSQSEMLQTKYTLYSKMLILGFYEFD